MIALKLHTCWQMPQRMQVLASMTWGWRRSPEMASTGQLRAQTVQPVQAAGRISSVISDLQTLAGQRFS